MHVPLIIFSQPTSADSCEEAYRLEMHHTKTSPQKNCAHPPHTSRTHAHTHARTFPPHPFLTRCTTCLYKYPCTCHIHVYTHVHTSPRGHRPQQLLVLHLIKKPKLFITGLHLWGRHSPSSSQRCMHVSLFAYCVVNTPYSILCRYTCLCTCRYTCQACVYTRF